MRLGSSTSQYTVVLSVKLARYILLPKHASYYYVSTVSLYYVQDDKLTIFTVSSINFVIPNFSYDLGDPGLRVCGASAGWPAFWAAHSTQVLTSVPPPLHSTSTVSPINCLPPKSICAAAHTIDTLERKSHLCIPFLGIARPQSQFPHSYVCERFIYSQDRSTYFLQQNRQTDGGNIQIAHRHMNICFEFSVLVLCSAVQY